MASEGSFTGTEVFIPIPAESSASLVDWYAAVENAIERAGYREDADWRWADRGQSGSERAAIRVRLEMGIEAVRDIARAAMSARVKQSEKLEPFDRADLGANRVQVLWFLRLLADMPEEGWRALLDATQELARSREAEIRGANAAASEARHVLGPRCDDLIDRGPEYPSRWPSAVRRVIDWLPRALRL